MTEKESFVIRSKERRLGCALTPALSRMERGIGVWRGTSPGPTIWVGVGTILRCSYPVPRSESLTAMRSAAPTRLRREVELLLRGVDGVGMGAS